MSRLFQGSALVAAVGTASPAFAAEGMPHVINLYQWALTAVHAGPQWVPTIGGIAILLLLTVIGLRYKAAVAASGEQVAPDGKFGMRFLIETILDFGYQLTKDNGGHDYRRFLPFMCGLFIFIMASNLTGLIPGFPPPTLSVDTNLAMGLCVFFVYNWAGIKEHGSGYIKHFLGPVWWIAPLFFAIELLSHGSRPISLTIRLIGNLYGDHTLVGVFTMLTYLVFPALLLFFGLLVAVVQSFVFTLLTGIYISMAISHDH